MSSKPVIITMASLKGGVGKSTLTILFSYIFKNLGNKVLLIDLDVQNSLTSYFSKYVYDIEKYNVYNLLKGEAYFDECINKVNDFMSIIPSHPMLRKFNFDNMENKEIFLEYFLNKNIINHNFDYVLIDTSPGFDFLLKSAIYVADHILIPVQVERLSIESLGILIQLAINEVKSIKNKNYNISIVSNQFIKNRNIMKDFENLLHKEYGEYIKGKIHSYNGIRIFMSRLLEPKIKTKYYQETEYILKNIFNI